MKINLKYKKKKFEIDVKVCNLFWMVKGLMFTRREKARALLLFDFKKPRRLKIHSFFCPKFLAVWLDEKNKVQEIKLVKPFNPLVRPKKKFNKLIEIPINKTYKKVVEFFAKDF